LQSHYVTFTEDETSDRLKSLLIRRCTEVNQCDFIVRAPGRVNLIGKYLCLELMFYLFQISLDVYSILGEHIDYSGYGVLPMDLKQSVFIAVAKLSESSQGLVHILSEKENWEEFTCTIEEAETFAQDGPPCPLKWYHYVLCGYRGFCDYARQNFPDWKAPSICMLIANGNDSSYLPMCAGLSSSSALVVASAMAVMRSTNSYIEPKILANICAACELLIGTKGGGMDQAACLLADSTAMMIEFTKPLLTTTPVLIPKGGVFCIADCGVRLNKAATPDYNTRVSQCREAALILLNNLEKKPEFRKETITLFDVQRYYAKERPIDMVGDQSPWMKAFPNALAESIPARRSMHCYSEAQRVLNFKRLCEMAAMEKYEPGEADQVLRKLGEIMNESHHSCRDLFDCSCPELDRLVKICTFAGSYGSRLTGAGWGGCVVSLVSESNIHQFMATVAKNYFNSTPEAIPNKLFYTAPGRAAGFIDVSPIVTRNEPPL
uniref:Galactokinase n=1 Tax=Rodentolepis nana TaxID=102285 RepID=A0A158QH45_RODNA